MTVRAPPGTDPASAQTLPHFIAVEGPIGVGKTTLARRLAHSFNYDILLETPERNPFLERFYADPRGAALPVQLFFLFERARQLQELRQNDMFRPVRIADFLIQKDRLFAGVNLDRDELALYDQVYAHLSIDAPTPDLVLYLQAPVDVLLERIERRGVPAEQQMDPDYLARLSEAYARFFHFYDEAPLIIVNAEGIDLADKDADYERLVNFMLSVKSGRHYYNPAPILI